MTYDCEGQISLFDKCQGPEASPVLLNIGQEIYMLERGDVKKAKIYDDKSWLCGSNDRGYRLTFESGGYGCAWNSGIGKTVFTAEQQAREQAEIYLNTHEVIRAENIHQAETTAYQYMRDDGRIMTAFYSYIDNGMVYIKEFMTYHHIIMADKRDKAIKKFMGQQEFDYCEVKQVAYKPVFKNMYRIKQKYDWDYAEAGHSYATG